MSGERSRLFQRTIARFSGRLSREFLVQWENTGEPLVLSEVLWKEPAGEPEAVKTICVVARTLYADGDSV